MAKSLEETKDWHDKAEPWMINLIKSTPRPASLEACQRDPDWWRLFAFICKENFCLNNVEFLDKVDEWRRAGSDVTKGEDIYLEFISHDGLKEVNLKSQNFNPLKEIFEEGEAANVEMFDNAYDEIFMMVEMDTYKGYAGILDNLRDEFLLEDMPDAPKEIEAPVVQEMTRDRVDMAVVDNFNKVALTDLPLGASTSFYQVGDLVIVEAGMGEDQPYMKWIRRQAGVTQGASITNTAKGGAFSSGTLTVSGAGDKDLFKKAILRVSKKKVVFS